MTVARSHWAWGLPQGPESVTAQAGAEHLAAELASCRAALDGLVDPLFLLDAEGRIVLANRAGEEFAGRSVTGAYLASFLRAPPLLNALDAVRAGTPRAQSEVTTPDGSFLARLACLPSGDKARIVLTLQDITAAKRLDRLRADFVANASHELRTPLANLIGYIETLQGPARDDAEARSSFLAIMHQSAQRMTRLVADLLSLSRIEFDEHRAPEFPVEIPAVLTCVIEALAPQAHARDMRIELDLAPDLPPVPGQEDQLVQLFQNLVDNALKYGRHGTPVMIRARHLDAAAAHGRPVEISVRDQGEGVAREHLPRLTERFFRCDPGRSRALGGTGLGLAIVKHIVNRHRGALSIISIPGEGSTFTVTLPRYPSHRSLP